MKQTPTRYIITLTRQQNGFQAIIKHAGKRIERENLRLNESDCINIKNQNVSLGDIVIALQNYDESWLQEWFDERGQLELGRHLYRQLFGNEPPVQKAEIAIISDDEHSNHLPWVLLAHEGLFLSLAGWSILLSPHEQFTDCELPPSPRLLIVAPEPENVNQTNAQTHIHALKQMLTSVDSNLTPVIVNTWQAFIDEVKTHPPDALYYYGHGVSNGSGTDLVFADENNQRLDIPVVDLIPLIKNKPPRLAYFNCCFGDAGGLLGVGKQLSRFIPAVLSNRTLAFVETAQVQALGFWQAIVLEGLTPHQGLSQQFEQLAEMKLSVRDIRWITPVLHRSYEQWTANPPHQFKGWQRDPHWRLRLDRIKQFGMVFYQTLEMLRNNKPRSLAYLWYGRANQGVEVFHERLTIELKEKLTPARLIEILPKWSDVFAPPNCFEDMFCQAFGISSLDDLGAKIRELNRAGSSTQCLIYVRHEPVSFDFTLETRFHPKYLTAYLQWWNDSFVPQLPSNCHGLLGLSYQLEQPAKFYEALIKKGLDDVELPHTVFRLLDELEKISKRDLLDFIKEHNIVLPPAIKNSVITKILDNTGGDYHRILDELQNIETRGWQMYKEQQDDDNWE